MTKEQFIEQIAQYVIKYAPKYGICVASPIIAQACKESGFGTSKKAQYHNYFGMKYRDNRLTVHSGYFCDTSAEQNKDGTYTNLSNGTKWFKFDSMEKGVEGYFQFINISNYASLKGVTDPQKYLDNIKASGYATSLTYVTSCMNDYIKKYNLTKYDSQLNGNKGGNNMYRVAIDSGHGSNTAGKRQPDGYREHYSNTYVAYFLNQILLKNGIDTVKTGWDDNNVLDDPDTPLSTRQKIIKEANCDIVVSIHGNAHGDGKSYTSANGVETLYHSSNAYIKDSLRLANCIQNELIKGTPQTNRKVKRQSLAMCNAKTMGVDAAVLVELAFMTNEREAALLKSDAFLQECAREIAQGIFNYFKITGNVNVPLDGKTDVVAPTTPAKPVTPTQPATPSTSNNSGLVAGQQFKLTNVVVYASSSATGGTKKSGTYYLWSTEVVKGRVRITNAKNRVGVSGQVSGWVNVSSLGIKTNTGTTTPSKPATTTPSTGIKAGAIVKLSGTTVYASSTATSGTKKTGTFYIWSADVVKGRVRITNAKNRVGVSGQITGWVNTSAIK